MGFTDTARKWLHPEEALYLIETVCFEIELLFSDLS